MKEYILKLTEKEKSTIDYALSFLGDKFLEECNSIADKILAEECRLVNENKMG